MTESRSDNDITRSLIPEVRQQEERLLAELEQVRADVAQAQATAEREAELRLSEARLKFPAWVEAARQRGDKELQAALQTKQSNGQDDIAQLDKIAESNLVDAVKHILSLVVPGAQA